MNDFSYISRHSDAAILRDIGAYIKARRLEQNLSQVDLAQQAAISRSTLSLIERGESISLTNLLKILRILDALYILEQFQLPNLISPIQIAKEEEKRRKRASKTKTQTDDTDTNNSSDLGW